MKIIVFVDIVIEDGDIGNRGWSTRGCRENSGILQNREFKDVGNGNSIHAPFLMKIETGVYVYYHVKESGLTTKWNCRKKQILYLFFCGTAISFFD